MFWVNPYSQRNQRHRFIYPEPVPAAKPEVKKAVPYVARRRVYTIDAEDWERTQEGLRVLKWQLNDLREHLARRRLGLKYNPDVDNQPRDDRGRWVDTGQGDKGPAGESPKDPGLITEPARLPLPAPRLLFAVPPGMDPTVHGAIEGQLSEYNWLSNFNRLDLRAVFRINAAAFEPGATRRSAAVQTGMLTRDEVREACPRYWEVQEITNAAALLRTRGAYPTAQAWGTAVHTWIRDEVNGPPTEPPSPPRDRDFRSELSIIKGEQATRYGQPGSKRVDIYENPRTGTVCIYDIKTGDSHLNFARMRELASNVGKFYPGTRRIVVTEVRPYQ